MDTTARPVSFVMAEHPYWSGVVLAAATIPVFIVLPEPIAKVWAALLLAVIGGAYIGFAARDGRPHANLIELLGGLGFGLVALAGLSLNAAWIGGGYIAHGFWDLVHHRPGLHADTPKWYIPFCVVYDWIVGAFLIVWL
jgi:hypothetical protein